MKFLFFLAAVAAASIASALTAFAIAFVAATFGFQKPSSAWPMIIVGGITCALTLGALNNWNDRR